MSQILLKIRGVKLSTSQRWNSVLQTPAAHEGWVPVTAVQCNYPTGQFFGTFVLVFVNYYMD